MLKVLPISSKKICKQINLSNMTYNHYGKIIRFKNYDSVERYYYDASSAEYKAFCYNASILFDCFKSCAKFLNNSNFYIASSEKKHIKFETSHILNNISKCNKVLLTDDWSIIEDTFIKALRYEFFPVFITTNSDVAIMPSDHLDIFIASKQELNLELLNLSPLLEITSWN